MLKPQVYLVGAGPGDPELLTVKAVRVLQAADAVVYDRLIGEGILELAPARARRFYVGKAVGRQAMRQEAINDLLVELALPGQKVVRLKGGDPFVFGRGGEEALHLVRHGIPVEVVPGVTAALGCAAATMIPLTHRGLATSVRFVTGHCRAGWWLDLNWPSLADPQTTLVFYMGLAHLDEITSRLVEAGLPAATPAAAIENGTTPQQRIVRAPLVRLRESVQAQALASPVLIVIGPVVDVLTDAEPLAALVEPAAGAVLVKQVGHA
ncbi:uroporphyrinogen-III C-methyltransferase [Benzoatithermus flavus]|uniref:uroporphyrinogen-III C-methyltransferase n=1 Tax=Benzoatithermus flavus TaxID=3108223 RepID=A0ABU8XW71_9PROT